MTNIEFAKYLKDLVNQQNLNAVIVQSSEDTTSLIVSLDKDVEEVFCLHIEKVT